MTAPTPMPIAQRGTAHARMIVTNPALYAHRPGLRLHAWAVLKSARGQYVHEHRLQRLQGATTNQVLADLGDLPKGAA